jgi:hypothetical protein
MANINDYKKTVKTLKKPNWDYSADKYKSGMQADKDNAAALQQINEIPGATDFLKNNPDMAVEVLKNPADALASYEKAIGEGGASGVGSPSAQITVDTPVTVPEFRDPTDLGLAMPSANSLDSMNKLFDDSIAEINANAEMIAKTNEAYMRGELPADVVAEIRRNTAEGALKGGQGSDSQAAMNLTARDLGTSSLALQQQGITNAAAVADIYKTVASLSESKRQFDETFALNVNQFLDNARKTDLTAVALEQERLATNAKNNLALVGYIGEMATARADISYKFAAADLDPSGATAGLDQIIAQMDALLV